MLINVSVATRPGNTGFFVPELLASVAGVFFEMGRNWDIFIFRHKKSTSNNRKCLIHLFFGGGSCAIRTRDHRIKSALPTT